MAQIVRDAITECSLTSTAPSTSAVPAAQFPPSIEEAVAPRYGAHWVLHAQSQLTSSYRPLSAKMALYTLYETMNILQKPDILPSATLLSAAQDPDQRRTTCVTLTIPVSECNANNHTAYVDTGRSSAAVAPDRTEIRLYYHIGFVSINALCCLGLHEQRHRNLEP
jgi:hypothetical protein